MKWILPVLVGGMMCLSLDGAVRRTPPDGAISGVVVDSAGQPVPHAVVALSGSVAERRHQTDERGRFVFEGLPSGRFSVTAHKAGYESGSYGQPGAGAVHISMRLTLDAAAWINDVKLVLYRSGAVSGSVYDEHRVPVAGAPVRVLRRLWISGSPRWSVAASTRTNDHGEYRIGRLPEGSYTVVIPLPAASVAAGLSIPRSVRPAVAKALKEALEGPWGRLLAGDVAPRAHESGRSLVYPTHYYPGTVNFQLAETVDVGEGADLQGIDITLRPAAVHRVHGRLSGPASPAGITVRLFAEGAETLGHGSETALTVSDDHGAFHFSAVPEGAYTLMAGGSVAHYRDTLIDEDGRMTPLPGDHPLSVTAPPTVLTAWPRGHLINSSDKAAAGHRAVATITVTESTAAEPIDLTLNPGVTVEGRVDGAPRGRVEVRIEPANGDPGQGFHTALLQSDGTFTIPGIQPGEYVMSTPTFDVIESVTCCGGRDLTSVPLRVEDSDIKDVTMRLTKTTASLAGRVTASDALRAQAVVLITSNRQAWTTTGVSSPAVWESVVSDKGAYAFERIRPGSYFVVAVQRLTGSWRDPMILGTLAAAGTPVVLTAGTTQLNIERIVR